MRTRRKTAFLLLAALLLLSACAAASSPQPGGGKKIVASGIAYDQIWLAILPTMTRRFDIKEIDKGKGYIKGTQNHWGVGEYLALFITPLEGAPPSYQIEAVLQRKTWDPRQWDEEVLADIKGKLEKKPRME